jgi:trimeric autotransporter adhesin
MLSLAINKGICRFYYWGTTRLDAAARAAGGRSIAKLAIMAIALVFALAASPADAQTLSLDSGSATVGGTASLNLTFNDSDADNLSGLQWTFSYDPTAIAAIAVSAGPVLTEAGKTVTCNGSAGSLTCLAIGMNLNTITDGIAAVASVTLAGTDTNSPISVGMTGGVGATPAGTGETLSLVAGSITVLGTTPTINGVSCAQSVLNTPGSATCTVVLSMPAPAAGVLVSLGSSNASLSLPSSVAVATGSASATFTVSSGAVATSQAAVITASYSETSASTSLALAPPVITLSALQCSPANVLSGGSSTCTVTLSLPALAGGATVALSSNNGALSVPALATVPRILPPRRSRQRRVHRQPINQRR